MERLEISKLFSSYEELGGKEITVCGWIKTLRDSKAIGFMEINDGSCFKSLQVVFESAKVENYKDIVKLNVGAAVRVTGTFILTPQANQPFELNASSVEVEGQSTPDYPLQKKRHTLEYMRTIAHLRPRANIYSAAFARPPLMLSTSSSMSVDLSMPILRSFRAATVRAQARCSR